MYGPLLSALLMGMIPVWGMDSAPLSTAPSLPVAAPVASLLWHSDEKGVPELQKVTSSGVLIMDLQSGQTVYARDPDVPRPMASLTKLMTALVIVEHHHLDEWVTVPSDIDTVPGTVAHLLPGQEYTVGDLLSALLIDSANDAAVTLARYHSGTITDFVAAMNKRAEELGLMHTSFENPMGLDDDKQWMSPRDLAWLTMFLQRHVEIRQRMSERGTKIQSREGQAIYLTHTHALLHADTPVIAGKTGTTVKAGQCLLSIVEEGKHQYIVILLHSADRYADMKTIFSVLASPLL